MRGPPLSLSRWVVVQLFTIISSTSHDLPFGREGGGVGRGSGEKWLGSPVSSVRGIWIRVDGIAMGDSLRILFVTCMYIRNNKMV